LKRGSLVLTVIAGLAVFIVILLFYLPASWFAAALPAQVRCNDLGGSVWRGECLGLRYQGAALGDATWNFAIGSALAGRLAGEVQVQGTALNFRADVDTNFGGVGELRNIAGNFVMDPALLSQLPREQRGTILADIKRLVLQAGGAPAAVEGSIELRDFRQLGAQPMELGSYQVVFDGQPSADSSINGKVRDLGGPYIVDATLTLRAPRNYLVQGYITGRTAAAERLVREITLGAMPDASGRSTFSFEGTY
jgi:hypothetical protein